MQKVHVSEALLDYVQALLAYTRESGEFVAGLSPRGGIALLRAAQAWALVKGHSGVHPEDLQAVLGSVVAHRLQLTHGSSIERGADLGTAILVGRARAVSAAPRSLARMQLGVARSLERWAAAWARRRQGADAHAIALKRRRIYILPTRFGVVFAAMVFAMLLGSLNYGASLGFALTFLLTGLGLVVMHHCHNNLLGATIKFVGAAPVFAGERAEFKIAVGNDAAAARFEIELKYRDAHGGARRRRGRRHGDSAPRRCRRSGAVGSRSSASGRDALSRAPVSRLDVGPHGYPLPRLPAPGRPRPAAAATAPAADRAAGRSPAMTTSRACAPRRPGDPLQRIAWKAYARNDLCCSKSSRAARGEPCLLDWDMLPELGAEQRLSQLARWCLDADAAGRSIALRLPGSATSRSASGRSISPSCLEALALVRASQPR